MSQNQRPLERQWKLLAILSETSDGESLQNMAQQLSVTTRTISRDLTLMREVGVPLEESVGPHGKKTWMLTLPRSPMSFTYAEAAALFVGRRFLEPLTGTFLWDATDSALRKIRNRLGSRGAAYMDELLDVFRDTKVGWSRYADRPDIVDTLVNACHKQCEVAVTYRSLRSAADETYSIQPYQLVFHKGTVYVVGFSCKSNQVRCWKTDRMSSALLTNRRFKSPGDFDLEEYRSNMFGVYPADGNDCRTIHVRFDKRVARYVREHRWHDSQQLTVQPDGSLQAEFSLAETEEFKRWIFSFGMHAEVLEPISLRTEIGNELKMSANIYSNPYHQSNGTY